MIVEDSVLFVPEFGAQICRVIKAYNSQVVALSSSKANSLASSWQFRGNIRHIWPFVSWVNLCLSAYEVVIQVGIVSLISLDLIAATH